MVIKFASANNSSDIVLSTLNARYSHSSLALRYLFANLKELQDYTKVLEFVINENISWIAEQILQHNPKIVGFGVYIWNALDISKLVFLIKKISPQTIIVLGGPEVSHFPLRIDFSLADYIIKNEGEIAFYELCLQILNNTQPKDKIIQGKTLELKNILLPYKYYTDEDIKNRRIYIEASRGCPFTCEFCLSSIDKSVRYFDLELILQELENLWQRGARGFKFIDRTFNLNLETASALIDFFLSKQENFYVHFEVIPELFPDELKQKLTMFKKGQLQLEVGIQTLNKDVAHNIKRPLNIKKIKENLEFLSKYTNAHLHLDLIVGLPGENLQSFADNLNALCSISDDEIQIGILKKLSGTTLDRHDAQYKAIYSNEPPYDLICNELIDFNTMQQMKRFAKFWDSAYNSGAFYDSVRLLWVNSSVFDGFWDFCIYAHAKTNATHGISQEKFAKILFDYLTLNLKLNTKSVKTAMLNDYARHPNKTVPPFLKN